MELFASIKSERDNLLKNLNEDESQLIIEEYEGRMNKA